MQTDISDERIQGVARGRLPFWHVFSRLTSDLQDNQRFGGASDWGVPRALTSCSVPPDFGALRVSAALLGSTRILTDPHGSGYDVLG